MAEGDLRSRLSDKYFKLYDNTKITRRSDETYRDGPVNHGTAEKIRDSLVDILMDLSVDAGIEYVAPTVEERTPVEDTNDEVVTTTNDEVVTTTKKTGKPINESIRRLSDLNISHDTKYQKVDRTVPRGYTEVRALSGNSGSWLVKKSLVNTEAKLQEVREQITFLENAFNMAFNKTMPTNPQLADSVD